MALMTGSIELEFDLYINTPITFLCQMNQNREHKLKCMIAMLKNIIGTKKVIPCFLVEPNFLD